MRRSRDLIFHAVVIAVELIWTIIPTDWRRLTRLRTDRADTKLSAVAKTRINGLDELRTATKSKSHALTCQYPDLLRQSPENKSKAYFGKR
jgi:hypothetical protein